VSAPGWVTHQVMQQLRRMVALDVTIRAGYSLYRPLKGPRLAALQLRDVLMYHVCMSTLLSKMSRGRSVSVGAQICCVGQCAL
jgi:hypothetical protein